MMEKQVLKISARIMIYATRWLVVLITDIGYSGRALHLVDVLDIFHLPFLIHSLCFFILLSTLGG